MPTSSEHVGGGRSTRDDPVTSNLETLNPACQKVVLFSVIVGVQYDTSVQGSGVAEMTFVPGVMLKFLCSNPTGVWALLYPDVVLAHAVATGFNPTRRYIESDAMSLQGT